MKTLFISLAFFLYAGNDLLTTMPTLSFRKDDTQLTLGELMDFKKKSTQAIDKILIAKGWENTTAEDLLEEKIEKGALSWKLNKDRMIPDGNLYYYPGKAADSKGPSIGYLAFNNHVFGDLVKQASAEGSKLKKCMGNEHDTDYGGKDVEVQHFYNNDYNVIIRNSLAVGLINTMILIEGKEE